MSEMSMQETNKLAPTSVSVFISYARIDLAQAELLRDKLIEAGFEAYLDKHDILPGEPWQERLAKLIETADTLIFLISSSSITSTMCDWEINEAERLSKRILPVVIEEVSEAIVPGRLKRLNYIFMRSDTERASGLPTLKAALLTNIEWIRQHTRFGQLAQEWRAGPNTSEYLLRGELLRSAENWITQRPLKAPEITADQYSLIQTSRKAAQRRQTNWIWGALTIAALSLSLAVVALWQRQIAAQNENRAILAQQAEAQQRQTAEEERKVALQQRQIAEQNEEIAKKQRDNAMTTQSRFLADLSQQQFQRGNHAEALLLALEALPDVKEGIQRPYIDLAEHRASEALQRLTEKSIVNFTGSLEAISPDGSIIAQQDDQNDIRLLDTSSGRVLNVIKNQQMRLSRGVFSADNKWFMAISGPKTFMLWSTKSGAQSFRTDQLGTITDFAITNNGSRFAVATEQDHRNTIFVYSTTDGKLTNKISEHPNSIYGLYFSPDGRRLLSTSIDPYHGEEKNFAMLWSLESNKQIGPTFRHLEGIYVVAFSADSRLVVTASGKRGGQSYENSVRVWDANSGINLTTLKNFEGFISDAQFNANATKLLIASDDQTARVLSFNKGAGEELLRLKHENSVSAARFLDNNTIVTASRDGVLRFVDTRSPSQATKIQGHKGAITSLFAQSASVVVTTGVDMTVRTWDVEPMRFAAVSLGPEDRFVVVNNKLFLSDARGDLWYGKLSDHLQLQQKMTLREPPCAMRYSKASAAILLSYDDGMVEALDPEDLHSLGEFKQAKNPEARRCSEIVEISKDRKLIAIGRTETEVEILDIASHKILANISVDEGNVAFLAFDSSESRLIVVSKIWDQQAVKRRNEIIVWDVVRQARFAKYFTEAAIGWAFSPSAEFIIGFQSSSKSIILRTVDGVDFSDLKANVDANWFLFPHALDASDEWFEAQGLEVFSLGCNYDRSELKFQLNQLDTKDCGKSLPVIDINTGIDGSGVVVERNRQEVAHLSNGEIHIAAISQDHQWVATLSSNRQFEVRRIFLGLEALISEAKSAVPRCLTPRDREVYFLSQTPPKWCLEQRKWPYLDGRASSRNEVR